MHTHTPKKKNNSVAIKVIHHTNRKRGETIYYLNKQAKKAFDNIQHLFMINALNKQNKRKLSLLEDNMIAHIKKEQSTKKST